MGRDGAARERIRERWMRVYLRHIRAIWAGVVLLPWGLLALLSVLFPHEVYDGFIYPYLWAPVVADAVPGSGESTNYNPVNTTIYAVWVAITMVGLYEVRRRGVLEAFPIDMRLVISILPLMVLGGVLRALQDSALFGEPTTYILIAPLIYLTVSMVAACIIIYSIWTSYPGEGRTRTLRFAAGCAAMLLVYALFLWFAPGQMLYAPGPLEFAAFTLLGLLLYLSLSARWSPAHTAILSYSLILLLFFIYVGLHWPGVPQWYANFLRFTPAGASPRPAELLVIPGVCTLIVLGFVSSTWLFGRWSPTASRVLTLENILLVTGQMLDATASWRGIDAYGYSEKNVLPILVTQGGMSPLVLFALKLFIVLPLIYLLDIALEKEFRGREELRLIIKMAVMLLGLAPGVRDMARIAMGV